MSPYRDGGRHLLLVEDNPGDAELIREYLQTSTSPPATITTVPSLGEAIEHLDSAHQPDAVLLDLRLPDGTGIECVQAVRDNAPYVPIVVLTGLEDDELGLSCIAAGAQDYFSKNEVRSQSLERAIAYAIIRIRERRARARADELQQRLAAIVDASTDAIVSTTVSGEIASWNAGAEAIFGYSLEEVIGRPVLEVVRAADPEAVADQTERITRLAGGGGPTRSVLVCRHKDGAEITLSIVGVSLHDAVGNVIGLAGICRDMTEARRRDAELARRHEQLLERDRQMRALARRLEAVREDERTRISREVHDELGQLLTGLKMDLRWIDRRLSGDRELAAEALAKRLEQAESLVDRTIASVQRIALELRPSALDALGLAAAIRDESRRFSKRVGIHTRADVDDAVRPSQEAATALFRIFQELLTNVARHAEASAVEIAARADDESWVVSVADNGCGMPGGWEDLPSLGILGMRERAGALGGSLDLKTSDDGGTIAVVRLPR